MNYVETVFYQRLIKAVRERIASVTDDTISGVSTWDAYVRNLGYIAGLQEACTVADNLKEEMSKE